MTFIIGFAGGLAAIGLLLTGMYLGWQAKGRQAPPGVEAPTEQESRRLQEEQEAFHLLQNYTVERAYGGREA